MITPREFWNLRSATYDLDSGTEYAAAYEKTVSNALKYLNGDSRVLEFACGTGLTTVEIAPHVAFVRAIDISEKMVEKARAKLEALGLSNVELSRTDLFDPCLEEGSFDAVTAFNVLLYVEDRKAVLERIRSLLKPGEFSSPPPTAWGRRSPGRAFGSFGRATPVPCPMWPLTAGRSWKERLPGRALRCWSGRICSPRPQTFFWRQRSPKLHTDESAPPAAGGGALE